MKNQLGFTFIEIVLVVAVLEILAGIVVAASSGTLRNSRKQAYETELQQIQQAIDGFGVRQDTPRFLGEQQFPILGAAKGKGPWYLGDEFTDAAVISDGILGNPRGGTRGGNPIWVDDDDGFRTPAEEVLNDEDSDGSEPGWHVQPVQFDGKTYYVDSRDYLIDFDLAARLDMVKEPPKSAAQDNCPRSKCTGSYIFYLNPDLTVETLLSEFPTPDSTGYQNAFP